LSETQELIEPVPTESELNIMTNQNSLIKYHILLNNCQVVNLNLLYFLLYYCL
jgi:hypothetical protein